MQDHNCHKKPTSVKQCETSPHKAYLCETVKYHHIKPTSVKLKYHHIKPTSMLYHHINPTSVRYHINPTSVRYHHINPTTMKYHHINPTCVRYHINPTSVRQRPGLLATEQIPDDAGVGQAPVQTQRWVKGRPHIAHLVQLLPHVAITDPLFIHLRVQTCTQKYGFR